MQRVLRVLILASFTLGLVACATPVATSGGSAADRLSAAAKEIDRAIEAIQGADIEKAKKEFKEFEGDWDKFEDLVKARSADSYKKIEDAMNDVEAVLTKATTVDKDKALAALRKLRQVIDAELSKLK